MDLAIERFSIGARQCPIEGKIETYNTRIDNKFMKIFPSGIYKLSAHAHSKEDNNVFAFSFLIKVEN